MNTATDLFGTLSLASIGPCEHFDAVHGGHSASVAYLAIPAKGKPHERTFPPDETRFVMETAPHLDGMDLYFSQSGFYRRRALVQIAALPALWVDLDFYKDPKLKRADPLELLGRAQARYPALPMPTLVISSGRGAYFEWIFEQPLTPADHAPWQWVTDGLIAMFKDFGADPACRDATRVLRIVGGTNQKNGRVVTGYRTGTPVTFDQMRRAVLGYAGAVRTIEAPEREQQTTPSESTALPQKSERAETALGHREAGPPRTLTENQAKAQLGPYRLHRTRLDDYATLAELRGGKLGDCRARMLFAVAVSLVWFIGDESRLNAELRDFASEHFQNPGKYGPGRVRAVIERLKLDQGGIVIPVWEGQRVPNRYRMRNSYLIDLLEISRDEQRELRTIISPEEKARRRRGKAGTMDRETYEETARLKRERIEELHREGKRQVEIAKAVGVDRRRVSESLKAAGAPKYKERTSDNGTNNTPEPLRRVLELRESGLPIRAIAAALGFSKSHVHRLIRQATDAHPEPTAHLWRYQVPDGQTGELYSPSGLTLAEARHLAPPDALDLKPVHSLAHSEAQNGAISPKPLAQTS